MSYNPARHLELDEALRVIADLKRRAKRSLSSRFNLILFRLACGCGMRRSEIAQLRIRDILLEGKYPQIRVPKAIVKGIKDKKRGRLIPLWWDRGVYEDIRDWVAYRLSCGAKPDHLVMVGVRSDNLGKPLTGTQLAFRWRTAIRCLGKTRVKHVSCHAGRHSFCSLAYAAGHSPLEIRDAVGHRSLTTTNIYLHPYVRDDIPDIFAPRTLAESGVE